MIFAMLPMLRQTFTHQPEKPYGSNSLRVTPVGTNGGVFKANHMVVIALQSKTLYPFHQI
tara:strand:- start:149 stop:328 length:180 start_codon:yes stop_codon:yes gene_type:complete